MCADGGHQQPACEQQLGEPHEAGLGAERARARRIREGREGRGVRGFTHSVGVHLEREHPAVAHEGELLPNPIQRARVLDEERGQAEAIAVNLREMFTFNVPIVAVVLGEGGSGGALGIGVADRVLILENSYYSVI